MVIQSIHFNQDDKLYHHAIIAEMDGPTAGQSIAEAAKKTGVKFNGMSI